MSRPDGAIVRGLVFGRSEDKRDDNGPNPIPKKGDGNGNGDDNRNNGTSAAQTKPPQPASAPSTSPVVVTLPTTLQSSTSTSTSLQAASKTTAKTSYSPTVASSGVVSASSSLLPSISSPTPTLASTSGSAATIATSAPSTTLIPQSASSSIITSQSATALAETASTATPSSITSKHESKNGISKSPKGPNPTFLILGGVGGGIAVVLLIGCILFFIRRRFRARRGQQRLADEPENDNNATPSMWDSTPNSSGSGRRATMSRFLPPIFQSPNPTSRYDNEMAVPTTYRQTEKHDQTLRDDTSTLSTNFGERQDRLGRARTDLLAERELGFGGGLLPNQELQRERIGDERGSAGARKTVMVELEGSAGWEAPVTSAGTRNSVATSAASVPKWRDPVTWAKDQARRNDSRQESGFR